MCAVSVLDEQPVDVTQDEQAITYSEERQARTLTLYILYITEMFDYDISIASIIDNLNRGFDTTIDLHGNIATLSQSVIDARHDLDEDIKPLLSNWRLERIGVCTKLILRMAMWELSHSTIEPKIILNEAIELAKCFSERDAYKFVNGILDEALKRLGKNSSPDLSDTTKAM